MNIDLKALEGCWFINQSNFPMWLKGDKKNPTFNYQIQEKSGKKGLKDVVCYQQNGKSKSIQGFDVVLDDHNTEFLWRGKGWLFFVTSKWSILHLSKNKEWAIIGFEKTLFTPKGYDVISRQKELSLAQTQEIAHYLKQLNIQDTLHTIQQN